MAESKIKRAGVTDLFNGQSDIVLFDEVSDYSEAKLSTLEGARSLGQIVQDSTEWTGEEPSVDNILDEQGDVITASVTAGTLGFSFEMADTSPDTFKEFLKGSEISGTFSSETAPWSNVSKVVGFGYQLPTMTRPIMIVNDEMNKSLMLPKAKITSNLTIADGLLRVAVTVVAENVDTTTLKTGMLIVGKTQYDDVTTSADIQAVFTEGGDISLKNDVSLDGIELTSDNDTTLNLGANKITSENGVGIRVSGGKLVINAEDTGGIVIGDGNDSVAVMAEEGSTVEINGGTFKVGSDALSQGNACIYSAGGTITINGGTYESESQFNGKYWVLNKKNDSSGKIEVKGGRFKNFNPGQPNTDDDESYLAEGYKSEQSGDYYVVTKNAV